MVLVSSVDASVKAETFAVVEDALNALIDDEDDPFNVPAEIDCPYPCWYGQVKVTVDATLADGTIERVQVSRAHEACAGTGRCPPTDSERTSITVRGNLLQTALTDGGLRGPTRSRAARLFGDKYGPAIAIVTADYFWFGGWCAD
jgi:hypothetical protein